MSLRKEVSTPEAEEGSEATFKQIGVLNKLTGLPWWKPESLPKPTVKQASLLIGAMMEWQKDKSLYNDGYEICEAIRIWFMDFEDPAEIHFRGFGGKKKSKASSEEEEHDTEEQPKSEPKSESKSKPQPKSESKSKPQPKPQPKSEPKKPEPQHIPKSGHGRKDEPQPEAKGDAVDQLEFNIEIGMKNIWLVGPAGCGKTTICKAIGEKMGLPVTLIPCGAGTSATTFNGYKYPERESTNFVGAYTQEGIIVLDEFTALEAQVAQIVNSALANDELTATTGTFQRHPNCIIIATSNTFGNGADRMYVSNNQLDASTNDRFVGATIEVDYSREYESQFDKEVVEYVWKMREVIKRNNLRKVASTRMIIAGTKSKKGFQAWKAAGKDTSKLISWKESLITSWTKDEKALLQ